jgi:phage terminase large subunit-like protein
VHSWDTANKATKLSDFSVCTSRGIAGKDLYLLHVLRKRMEYPELKRAVLEQAGREPRGIYQYYKELSQQPQTARSEPLSAMAKRLGLLR